MNVIPRLAHHFLDGTPEGSAKYEAALWQECNKYFDCETKVYAWLGDLQGRLIPRMYAYVRIVQRSSYVSQDLLQSQMARSFEVKGIILEFIPGYDLRDISTSPLAPPSHKWSGIVQSAVDAVHEINRRGLIMDDCAPRNVIIDQRSQRPFIIDLAQCSCKDEIIEESEKISEWDEAETGESSEEDGVWDPDVEYWEQVIGADNPGAIGAVMAQRLLRDNGIKLNIKYPDVEKLLNDIKCLNP